MLGSCLKSNNGRGPAWCPCQKLSFHQSSQLYLCDDILLGQNTESELIWTPYLLSSWSLIWNKPKLTVTFFTVLGYAIPISDWDSSSSWTVLHGGCGKCPRPVFFFHDKIPKMSICGRKIIAFAFYNRTTQWPWWVQQIVDWLFISSRIHRQSSSVLSLHSSSSIAASLYSETRRMCRQVISPSILSS